MIERFLQAFPAFHQALAERDGADIEQVLPPATEADLAQLEAALGVPLPDSYKRLLRCARGFWLLGGVIQFGKQHPFFHSFDPLEKLNPKQRAAVARRGGVWPPPSDGMLCFAEFFLESDGDQVLWDVRDGLQGGEYPIYYYAHEEPAVRRMEGGFEQWLGGCFEHFDDQDCDGNDD